MYHMDNRDSNDYKYSKDDRYNKDSNDNQYNDYDRDSSN